MQAEYVQQLPNDLQELVQVTENSIGFPIGVVLDPERARGVAGNLDPLACEVDAHSARILIPSGDQFRAPSVFHELLHIRRFLVEDVPRLTDCESYDASTVGMRTALTMHDNCMEHLIIVPIELARFPDRQRYWERVMRRFWKRIADGEGSALHRQQGALANWAFVKLVLPDSPSLDIAAWRALRALGLQKRANRLCEALFPVLSHKPAAVKVWFEQLEIPLEIASLEYFAPQEHRSWEEPLAVAL